MSLRQAPTQVDTSGAIVEDIPMGTIEVVGQRPPPEAAPGPPWWMWLVIIGVGLWVVNQ